MIITNIVSPEREEVALSTNLDPKGHSVEVWLMSLEEKMRETIRDIMKMALADYLEVTTLASQVAGLSVRWVR